MADCIFCRLLQGELPGQQVAEGEGWVAFRDIHPQAPSHILVIPRKHIASLSEVSGEHTLLLGQLLEATARVAHQENLDAYRVVINNGAQAGQSVFHLHLHLLGGRPLGWPPG